MIRLHQSRPYDCILNDKRMVRIWTFHDGHEYFVIAPYKPGRALRELRERAGDAIEVAVERNQPGEVRL